VGAEALPRAVRRVWSGLVSSGAAAAAFGDAAPHLGATPPDSRINPMLDLGGYLRHKRRRGAVTLNYLNRSIDSSLG